MPCTLMDQELTRKPFSPCHLFAICHLLSIITVSLPWAPDRDKEPLSGVPKRTSSLSADKLLSCLWVSPLEVQAASLSVQVMQLAKESTAFSSHNSGTSDGGLVWPDCWTNSATIFMYKRSRFRELSNPTHCEEDKNF